MDIISLLFHRCIPYEVTSGATTEVSGFCGDENVDVDLSNRIIPYTCTSLEIKKRHLAHCYPYLASNDYYIYLKNLFLTVRKPTSSYILLK